MLLSEEIWIHWILLHEGKMSNWKGIKDNKKVEIRKEKILIEVMIVIDKESDIS